MHKPVVGVLRGGPSSEYEVSLKTGHTVLKHLPEERYTVRDIFIDKQGAWHVRGREVEPARAMEQVDVMFNALHGAYGEDGTVQRLLDTHGVRYTGSGALASGIAMNKVLTKRHLAKSLQPVMLVEEEPAHNVWFAPHIVERATRAGSMGVVLERVPPRGEAFRTQGNRKGQGMVFAADVVITEGAGVGEIRDVMQKISPPYVVKPATGGSSVATSLVSSYDDLLYAVMLAFEYSNTVLVEQFVRGTEVTVGVAEDFRGEDLYAFPPILIRPTKSGWFDYAEKYEGHAEEICPAPLPKETTQALLQAAKHVHRTLGLRDYSRSDFILGRDGVYFLEVNTLPGLTPASLVPKAVAAVGATLPQFLDHIATRALSRK